MIKLFEEVEASTENLRTDWRGILRYVLATEVHVYAFAIAANVLIAFFPFMIVMLSLFRSVLHWPEGVTALYAAVNDYFAGDTGGFLVLNLNAYFLLHPNKGQWLSWLLLLVTANGVFLPLEVAFNTAWGVKTNRSLLKNQVVSMALILSCGMLALLSGALTAGGIELWQAVFGASSAMPAPLVKVLAKLASIPVTILILFLIYCYLPNIKVPKRAVLPRAVVVGFFLESLKWVNLLIWPWISHKFYSEFFVFVNSVTILTWSFFAGMIVLAGAQWTAQRVRAEAWATEAANQDRMGARPDPGPQAL